VVSVQEVEGILAHVADVPDSAGAVEPDEVVEGEGVAGEFDFLDGAFCWAELAL
jgi:hypothetical protein